MGLTPAGSRYYDNFLPDVKAFPPGFQMVAGNPYIRNFTGPFPDVDQSDASVWLPDPSSPEQQFWLAQRAIGFNCLNPAYSEGSMFRHQFPSKEYMDVECTYGLRLELAFPSCGNGSLDSLDHKSHTAYPNLVKLGNCPESHPVHYPELFYETIYDTYAFANISGQFVLSHGDPVGTGSCTDRRILPRALRHLC